MSDDRDGRHSFWMDYDSEMLRIKKKAKCDFYKRLGDGRLYVWEIATAFEERWISEMVVRESLECYSRINALITRQSSPRPVGFRLRAMAGIVSKEMYPDGDKDYLGYCVNTCHKLLLVEPDIGVMIHESVKETLVDRSAFVFKKITSSMQRPGGVDLEDMSALWSVAKIKRKRKC